MTWQLSPEVESVLLAYDIMCQWIVHHKKRFSEAQFLNLRDNLLIIPAIGKFHLAAHILECFWKYSLNFISGAGQTDGEIIETLWSNINEASAFIRGMSPAHCQEVLDDLMMDSNWKKLTGMTQFLIAKLDRAMAGSKESTRALKHLNNFVGLERTKKWSRMERKALKPGGIGYKVYESADVPIPLCKVIASESLRMLISILFVMMTSCSHVKQNLIPVKPVCMFQVL